MEGGCLSEVPVRCMYVCACVCVYVCEAVWSFCWIAVRIEDVGHCIRIGQYPSEMEHKDITTNHKVQPPTVIQ